MRVRHSVLSISVVCLSLIFSACANLSTVDKPLSQWRPEMGKDFLKQAAGERSGEILVLVSFSGGGTRAAAFAYGTLKALSATRIMTENGETSLLHEIDAISSVSGGSFTSAYYGIRGDRIFDEFESRFLRKNVEGALIGSLFNPLNWPRLMSFEYGRADMAADYYDRTVFEGATFADLQRPDGPLVIINATDLASGVRFPFTKLSFDPICHDLDSYPVARAVTASSAVPVLFTPITVRNYAGTCGYQPPEWLAAASEKQDANGSMRVRKLEARILRSYLDRDKTPWIHLVDGGIADNLGLRSFINTVVLAGDQRTAFVALHHPEVRQILIIMVNSLAKHEAHWPLKRAAPGLSAVIDAVSSDQIGRYSLDTMEVARAAYGRWAGQMSTPRRPVHFNFVEVSFEAVGDDTETRYLNGIGTNFNLKDEEVDRLIDAAGRALDRSPEFKVFLDRNRKRVMP